MGWLTDLLASLNSLIQTHATAWWIYPLTTLLACLDGIFPPIPSESITITLAAYSAAGHGPDPVLLGLCALGGAMIGDNISYAIGRFSGLSRLHDVKHDRLRRAFRWAERELDRRSAMLIFVARYIPVGRLAVNVCAGAVRLPWKRFFVIDTIAGIAWAAYCVAIGYFFGSLFDRIPMLGSVIGIGFAVAVGWLVDRVVQSRTTHPTPQNETEPTPATPRSEA